MDGLIASPFYHNLHVAQMQAMYELTGEPIFLMSMPNVGNNSKKNPICKGLAFIRKSIQKIFEK